MPNRKLYVYFSLPFFILMSIAVFWDADVTDPYFPLGIVFGILIVSLFIILKLRSWRKGLSKKKLEYVRKWHSIYAPIAFLIFILSYNRIISFIEINPYIKTIFYSAFGVIFIWVGFALWYEARYKKGIFQE